MQDHEREAQSDYDPEDRTCRLSSLYRSYTTDSTEVLVEHLWSWLVVAESQHCFKAPAVPANQFGKLATSAVAFQHKELSREDYGYECGLNVEEIALADFAL